MGSQKDSTDTNSGSNVNSGQGMSRAAMRRNKKKHKGENGPAISKDTSSTVAKSEVTVRTTLSNKDPPSLLESAYLAKLLDTGKAHHNNVEFKAFLQAMSRQLPLSFRIRQYENDSERDETDFDKAIARLGEQEFLDLLEAIPFGNTTLYRAHSTKSLSSTTEVLCKARLNIVSPALKEFLVKTSQSGVLARQEIGSMLPVMALYDVGGLRAGSTVLDVCASPGSKTLQALEIIGPKGR
jgi:16S rRNA C967 or C1407 C5-methylase (RsmB/RsmF family)